MKFSIGYNLIRKRFLILELIINRLKNKNIDLIFTQF